MKHEALEAFEQFLQHNPQVEYFMLDGSHRTTALTLTKGEIETIVYDTNEDIQKARKLVSSGKVNDNGSLDRTVEENCIVLNEHFKEKPYFMTVEQKTQRMVHDPNVAL